MNQSQLNKQKITPVILCGGVGSRLWPLSRAKHPKQFLALCHESHSMLQQTLMRVVGDDFAKPIIVANEEHRFLIASHLQEINLEADIILEPQGRNTAAAIAVAAMHASPDATLLVLPSDHIITDISAFLQAVQVAYGAAQQGHLVTFGITPEYAHTGYGYISQGELIAGYDNIYHVAQFVEKPNKQRAEEYLATNKYSWNSGMFMFASAVFLEEIAALQPTIHHHVKDALKNAQIDADFIRLSHDYFVQLPNISVDVAVMEQTDKAAIIPLQCGWSDAGSWDCVWASVAHDANGNAKHGLVVEQDCRNNYLYVQQNAPIIAAIGVDNLTIISTPDVVMIAKQTSSQAVKELSIIAQNISTELLENHVRVVRPWGFYETLMPQVSTPEIGYKVKHINVAVGGELSTQMHHRRLEHWVIVQGNARVVLDAVEHLIDAGGYIFIPQGAVHSISNIGKTPLYFVEVQMGDYLGEDDIVRFHDKYGRN